MRLTTPVLVEHSFAGHGRRGRCQALGVGVLSVGYGLDELERAGRVGGSADMLERHDEVTGRR